MRDNTLLFIVSLPLIIITFLLWFIYAGVALLAIFIGGKKAFNLIYKTKEWM